MTVQQAIGCKFPFQTSNCSEGQSLPRTLFDHTLRGWKKHEKSLELPGSAEQLTTGAFAKGAPKVVVECVLLPCPHPDYVGFTSRLPAVLWNPNARHIFWQIAQRSEQESFIHQTAQSFFACQQLPTERGMHPHVGCDDSTQTHERFQEGRTMPYVPSALSLLSANDFRAFRSLSSFFDGVLAAT